MDIHSIFSLAVSAAITFVLAALGKVLVSQQAQDFITAASAKLAGETNKLLAEADATHNALLQVAVHAAMTYAENHQATVLKDFDSKADYVIASIDADPRFAHLNLPLDAIKHLVEQLYNSYFANLPKAVAPAPVAAQADNIGGPGK